MVAVPDDRIVFNTYLSHSYRTGDIDVNDMFWSVFADRGFSFMVDARSDYFSLLYLETMMRRSHCFVAVVPRRDESPNYSAYIKFEFDMARLARKPRFLVRCVDTNNDAFPMLQHDFQTEFATAFPKNSLPDLRRAVAEFRVQLEAHGARPITRSHLIGVLLEHRRRSRVFRQVQDGLLEVAGKYDYTLEVLETAHLDYGRLTALDRYDLLIIDASGRHVPPELFAFAHSRLVPTIKLVPLNDGEFPNDVRLPTISESLRSTPTDPLLYWRTPDELTITVDRELNELRRLDRTDQEQHATTVQEAKRYFRSLGRARLRVFLSNASEDQDLAVALSEALDDRYVDHFHYKDPRDLRSGVDWRLQLAREVSHECGVFVMLVSEHYWGSQWCTQEYQAAKTRFEKNEMVILPFKIGPARDEHLGSIQTPDLTQRRYSRYSTDELAREIADLIADRLERGGDLRKDLLQAEQIATLHAESIDIRPEAVIGGTDESLPAQWLVEGGFACRSISRLTVLGFRKGNPDLVKGQRRSWHGTGCLIDDGILLTNYHVIAGSADLPCSLEDFVDQAHRLVAQFGYISYRGQTRQFRVAELIAFDKELDYAAVRLEPIAMDRRPNIDDARILEDDPMSTIRWWGKLQWHPSASLNQGERLNIVQHPAAGPMMVAFRRNTFQRFSVGNTRIEYTTDTSEGSSGSPVFDDKWYMRALHSHARFVPEGTGSTLRPKANVGIPIEAIIKHIVDERPDVMSKEVRRSPAQDG